MKVINRIMLSSALLVMLSLLSLLTVFGIILFFDSMNGDGGKEMLDAKLFKAEEQMSGFDASAEQWGQLHEQLDSFGYQLLVMRENNVIYNTLADSGEDRINSLTNIRLGKDVLAGRVQDATFIAMNKESYLIYAVKQTADKSGGNFYAILKPAILISIAVIVVIVLLSQLFTRRMAYRIVRPLNALSEGARRIENGDLAQPIIYKGNDEFASVCTAFNHMQEHLLEERRKNNAYEQARIDLVAGISHDLRTPLTSIKGYIKGLRDGVAQTQEKREQYLKIAYQKSTEMDKLLQKLFYFSSLETGNLPLALKLRDLGQFAQHYEAAVHEELAQMNATLTASIEPAPHPVRLDSEQMNRVMANLTENAIKYAGVSPLRLTVSVWREGDSEHLLFADNGQGVPEEHLPHLFEQFWRGDEARTQTDGNSSGLGLYIVNYIVERHGGTVTARNHHGLQIEIVLPGGKEASVE
ncbi:HAMP domain-containing sensor histidine kinase [Paenibacillus sp. ATY16]|uniref:HAMP domain-containing sensor histidine kinase n=1 Tax=Paenibacillus sp. ATY16 TaxID=1759312 RepID=UPI000E2EFFAD|nr:HAMP domain-containing sensor histidine kinase [Paenibacillus sp. ATY16]MCK9861847.1 HAMP domain-containing histidine kinase [Paenibacillus sp. ATY16]